MKKTKCYRKILKLKKKLDRKALRFPKTNPQWRDRVNWDRVRSILVRRYDGKGFNYIIIK